MIAGLQKMTLLDYPGKIACTVFLQGCNLRCPFCHNGGLLDGCAEEVMSAEELLRFLKSRQSCTAHGVDRNLTVTGLGEFVLRTVENNITQSIAENFIRLLENICCGF